uniref:Syntaxin N-terminal domain-containing protein n=1 Tax=Anopheles albimanus TaxID=7167 RepID=A0A182F635_ANOAL
MERYLWLLILEINSEVALFRDLLIHVGQSRDCPELREKIRKLRRSCVEACKHTAALILPQIRTRSKKENIEMLREIKTTYYK